MFTKFNFHSIFLAVIASLTLNACGGGDSSGDNTPPSRSTGSISGNVFDAPVYGSTIYVWEYENGKIGRQLGTTKTDAFGNYSVDITTSSGPLLVKADGGTYTDPLTGEQVSTSNGKLLELKSVVNYSEGTDQNLMITPLTNIATGLTEFKQTQGTSTATAVTQALETVNAMYGFDVNETKPIDITNGGQSSSATPGHKYGALLTAYSSYSYDLIKAHGNSENVYTSMHLADIQYRDVLADGYLDGQEIDALGGGLVPISFGQREVTSDLYTNHLAQHVLIVVNDPTLNISGTKAEDYEDFSKQINDLGIPGSDGGAIPPRDEVEIDTEAPVVTRTDDDVLSGTDVVDIKLVDEIGVADLVTYVQYELYGVWSEEFRCDDLTESGSQFCEVDFTNFEKGMRETSVKVSVNTLEIDKVDIDSDTELSNVTAARLVFYPSDVLGNPLSAGDAQGTEIAFDWDNNAPVIEVTSEHTINNTATQYVLKGIIKEDSQDIESATVAVNGGLSKELTCKPTVSESGSVCTFEEPYGTEDFSSTTLFEITATDTQGNVGVEPHTVSKDDQPPTQVITYPQATNMTFIDESGDTYEANYTSETYTASNVHSSTDYLKIDYLYASSGISNTIPGVSFEDFNVNLLKERNIPYVQVVVSDPQNETIIGSSAEKLKLSVTYSVSQNGDDNYVYQTTTDSLGSSGDYTAKIPHEAIETVEGRVSQVVYYVPFVEEILGKSFKNVSESSSQKLVIQTKDESENVSSEQEVYFRSSFDLPTISVVTPFIGARVQLEGLTAQGDFTSLASCISTQNNEPNSGSKAYDVASCSMTTDVVNYDFMRVRLLGPSETSPHYYQWEDNSGAKAQVDLNQANIGAYFKLDGSQTFYVTELATYHTGLFDYLWNESSDKTPEKAMDILESVQLALAGKNNNSFFGFDPTVVSYATNEMLRTESTPEVPTNEYMHRFLVEAIKELASQETERNNSLDFASAMYDDFSYDGKANGVGAGGNKITLDGYEFGPNTYREELAQTLYNLMTNEYGIEAPVAQLFADDISKAYPLLDGEPIFKEQGGSIDTSPPAPSFAIEEGRSVVVEGREYITGEVTSRILLEDPSGIDETPEHKPAFSTMWLNSAQDETPIETDIKEDEENSTKYAKIYRFSLDTEAANLPDMVEFVLEITARDSNGTAWEADDPFVKTYYIDNDYPTTTYEPPVDSSIYLNASTEHELTFGVDDIVGDILDDRRLVFTLPSGIQKIYGPEHFYQNKDKSIAVKICDSCEAQGNTISPGNGNWSVGIRAEDNLGNKVSELTLGAPKFDVLIDSIAPTVESEVIEKRLGGNSIWTPVVGWGDLSQGSNVDIGLRRGSGQMVTLQACEEGDEQCKTQPYLIGEQPDVKVQLVADAFDYAESNEFHVTATDSAYPPNVSTKGIFTFRVDNQGPTIKLNTPWASNCVSDECFVLGRTFDMRFLSVTDESGVQNIQIFQEGQEEPIKTSLPEDTSEPFNITLTRSDTDRINITEDGEVTGLYAQAVDTHGFVSKSNTKSFILDRKGPTLGLNGYDEAAFYLANYTFTITAQDLNANGANSPDGVDKSSIEYWTYTNTEPPEGIPGTAPDEDLKFTLTGLSDGEHKVRIAGNDVRGNGSQVDLPVQIRNAKPQISSYQVTYLSGDPLEEENVVTRDESVVISMNVTDPSGIEDLVATYQHSEQSASNPLDFSNVEGTDQWTATLSKSDLSDDGTYALAIKAYNKVRYTNVEDRNPREYNSNLSVQRQGVALEITSPENFQTHISTSKLQVEFDALGEVKGKSLECWVRENYTSNEVPEDEAEPPYTGVLNISQDKYTCTLNTDTSMAASPVALITRVVGTNGKTSVQTYNFSMMDAEAPIVVDGDIYNFKGSDVWFDADGNKMLAFDLSFDDGPSGSGVDISTEEDYPKLAKKAGLEAFTPKSCKTENGKAICTYSELYSSIIDGLSSKQEYRIKGLKDVAGNITPDHDIELLRPGGTVLVNISNPEDGSTINGKKLVIDFSVTLGSNSSLYNLIAEVGDESFDYKDKDSDSRFSFTDLEECNDGSQCSTFTTDLPEGSDGQSLKAKIVAIDVWDKSSNDNGVTVWVDNTPPVIGDSVEVTVPNPAEDKVRFRFDIADAVSGLKEVTYSSFNPSFAITKDVEHEDDPQDLTYFELTRSQLGNLDEIKVDISATDSVGLNIKKSVVVDIKNPEITLSLEDGAEVVGGKLIFKEQNQPFEVNSAEGENINAHEYIMNFASDEQNNIEKKGEFSLSSVRDNLDFSVEEQGVYQFTLGVTDSIGREVSSFTLDGKKYDAKGLQTVVDYVPPSVSQVSGSQVSMKPESGRYRYQVSATILDANLNLVSSTAEDAQSSPFTPETITKPDNENDPYIIEYLLAPGDYTVKVIADDLAGHVTESPLSITVEEAPEPTLTISAIGDLPMAGGKELDLKFVFSEEVMNFEASDIKITSGNSEDNGSLVDGSLTSSDNITWSAKYLSPENQDKDITIKVEDGSYQSVNTIPGKGDSLVIGVEGVLPTLTTVTFDPIHQAINKLVTVELEFDKDLERVTAELEGNNIELEQKGESKKIWIGDVNVADTPDLTAELIVSDFEDLVGNVGATDSSHELPITPTLAITPVGTVNESEAANLVFEGTSTRFNDQSLAVVVKTTGGSEVTRTTATVSNDAWSAAVVDLSEVVNGDYTVTVTGTNEAGVTVEESSGFQLVQSAPVLDSVSFAPVHQAVGGSVDVTLQFSKPLQSAEATLGGTSFVLTASGDDASQWTGTVTVPSTEALRVALEVSNYLDLAGNVGATDSSHELPITPTLA
ncbi:hypothetical protein EK599_21660, partial [Vibrio sp. T187]|uniref:Ig-like domain-containing protein n=1 Tax=Vibrio TaxID=662 RepID=UPI0010C979E6